MSSSEDRMKLAWRVFVLFSVTACTGNIGRGPASGPDDSGGTTGQGASGGSNVAGRGGSGGTTGTGGSGSSGSGGSGGGGPVMQAGPGQGRMRLLTRAQLENTLNDLLGTVDLGPTPP